MSSVPLVRLLTTGGTIATTRDPATSTTTPSLSDEDIARRAGSDVRVEAQELARTPSWALGPGEMSEIALAARSAVSSPDTAGVVVTHGTTTLEYTAFLTHLVCGDEVPIVFTGAMRRADDPDADGPRNLRDALVVATAAATRGWGALICLAGKVMAAESTWKRHRTRIDAFEDVAGPLATIQDGTVTLLREPTPKVRALSGQVVEGVVLVKAYPGAAGSELEAALRAGAPGIVVEGLPGVGGIPPGMNFALREAAEQVPVVIASRSPAGVIPDPPTGGTGEPLREMPLISAGRLSAEKAWVLLSLALAEGGAEGVREIFDQFAGPQEERRSE